MQLIGSTLRFLRNVHSCWLLHHRVAFKTILLCMLFLTLMCISGDNSFLIADLRAGRRGSTCAVLKLEFSVFACVWLCSILVIEEVSRCFLQKISSLRTKSVALLHLCYCRRHSFLNKALIKLQHPNTHVSNPPEEGSLQSPPDVNKCLVNMFVPLP